MPTFFPCHAYLGSNAESEEVHLVNVDRIDFVNREKCGPYSTECSMLTLYMGNWICVRLPRGDECRALLELIGHKPDVFNRDATQRVTN